MERRRAAVVCAVSMTAGSALPVPGASAGTNPLVVLLGAGIAGAAWTDFCNTLIPLAFIAVSAGIALGPMGFEARANRRISAGGAT